MVEIERCIINDFMWEASTVRQLYKHRLDPTKSAQAWGGCFTGLNKHITYGDVWEYLDNHESILKQGRNYD